MNVSYVLEDPSHFLFWKLLMVILQLFLCNILKARSSCGWHSRSLGSGGNTSYQFSCKTLFPVFRDINDDLFSLFLNDLQDKVLSMKGRELFEYAYHSHSQWIMTDCKGNKLWSMWVRSLYWVQFTFTHYWSAKRFMTAFVQCLILMKVVCYFWMHQVEQKSLCN